jgi:sugar phosphate isomerase/epimerase
LKWIYIGVSGHDPLQLFKEHQDVSKDMDKVNPDWNAIGSGSINFKAIFAKAELAGMKRFYLEHESNYKPNPIESAITSFNYISKSLI